MLIPARPQTINIKKKIDALKQKLPSVFICGGSNKHYRLVGAYDPQVYVQLKQFVIELLAMKKYIRQGLQFRNLAWKNLQPEIMREIGDLENGSDLMVPFQHDSFLNMDFIWMENTELPPGDFDRAIAEIDYFAHEICGNEYILKNFGKLLHNPMVQEIEDPATPGRETLFLEQQITESIEALKSPFICVACTRGLKTKQSVFAHLKAKHSDHINVHEVEEYRSTRLTRAQEKADRAQEELERRDRHHRIAHPECNTDD